jgi:alpha-N-arabinofuranosidase
MITVNVQTGTPEEAAAWVAYVNNGQRRVDYWEIGNELYVDPRVFDPTLTPYTPTTYGNRFLEYAQAMRAVDPTIKLGASMDYNYGRTTYHVFPDWTQTVLSIAGGQIDFVAVHNGFAPVLPYDADWNVRTVYGSMLGTSSLLDNNLQQLGGLIDTYAGQNAPNISIAATEWGPSLPPIPRVLISITSRRLGRRFM